MVLLKSPRNESILNTRENKILSRHNIGELIDYEYYEPEEKGICGINDLVLQIPKTFLYIGSRVLIKFDDLTQINQFCFDNFALIVDYKTIITSEGLIYLCLIEFWKSIENDGEGL